MDARPAYLAAPTISAVEQSYVARRVIYLLGTKDTNPNHPALDKSCMAEAEGPYRYARGHAYAAVMQARAPSQPVGRAGRRPRRRQDADLALRPQGAVRFAGVRGWPINRRHPESL
jgi:hypothetical protein